MAFNKGSFRHPAAWVHGGIHTGLLLLVFPWYVAVAIGFTHMLIDTRRPLLWWIKHVKQMTVEGPHVPLVEVWLDQVFHIVVLAIAALLIGTYVL